MASVEFEKRDEMGLQKFNSATKNEAEARAFYFKFIGNLMFVKMPIAVALVYTLLRFLPGQAERIDAKFEFIRAYDLGWVFVAPALLHLGRTYLMINANGARAEARVERPDQHVYKIMSPNKYADAPYVLMANTGAAGRFNRAQRSAYNTDEVLPLFAVGLVLVAACFGPLALVLGAINVYGRTTFANAYKADQDTRGPGFMAAAASEYLTMALVQWIALKSFIPALP